jgi:deazaflavin-dependent oxidoreductase (nitroreductase family)
VTPQRYQRGRWLTVENRMMSALTRLGVVPGTYLLTTTGRKSGLPRSNPVTLVKYKGARWLVAPYGDVPWVLNARASGEVSLSRGRRSRRFVIRPATPQEAGEVLQRYVAITTVTAKYFAADKNDPAEAFAAESSDHPVFELVPRSA